MIWFTVAHIFSSFIGLMRISRLSENDKDLEILILRHQLAILKRKQKGPFKPNRAEKLTLAVLAAQLKAQTNRPANKLRDVIRIFQPETVFGWHRELVRRKWIYTRKNKEGRPRISQELKDLVIRLAQENPSWGYGKIEGELLKLGFKISDTTVRNVLKAKGILPAPVRAGSIGWRTLMSHYKEQLLACDFFVIETIRLRTLYCFFFIELGTRYVHLAGITDHPNGLWVAQQARNIIWLLDSLDEREANFIALIRDNDKKYISAFDAVFESEGIHVIRTPFQAPNANSFSERWVRSAREECLDKVLILNEAHLRRVLQTFVRYYNVRRPHQGLAQQSPIHRPTPSTAGSIQRQKVLGGIINDYSRAAGDIAVCPS